MWLVTYLVLVRISMALLSRSWCTPIVENAGLPTLINTVRVRSSLRVSRLIAGLLSIYRRMMLDTLTHLRKPDYL